MSTPVRWIVGAVAALLVVCLLVWARGNEHHHGIQIGSLAEAAYRAPAGG